MKVSSIEDGSVTRPDLDLDDPNCKGLGPLMIKGKGALSKGCKGSLTPLAFRVARHCDSEVINP